VGEVSPPFSLQEQANIKRYLSYPDWRLLAQSIQLGFPSGSQPLFLVQEAFDKISPEGRINVRYDLNQLCAIEAQKNDAPE